MRSNKSAIKLLRILKILRKKWKTLVLIFVPIILSPLVATGNKPLQCGFIILVVSVYWVTEVMNMAITSLIPVVLFPFFEILTPDQVSACYMKDITLMLIGGLIVAKTIEKQNLHCRFALKVLRLMGPHPMFQYLGFMLSTWFLSMWVSNSTTTAMMITLADAVVDEWKVIERCTQEENASLELDKNLVQIEGGQSDDFQSSSFSSTSSIVDTQGLRIDNYKRVETIGKGLLISIAYSATCGGMATIPGTPPNLVFYGYMTERYSSKLNLNFSTFMLFSFPMSLINITLCWLLLLYRYVGLKEMFKRKIDLLRDKKIMELIENQLEAIGPVKYGEISTLAVLCLLIFLRIMRETALNALDEYLSKSKSKFHVYWTDGVSAILAAILVFNLPNQNPFKTLKHKSKKLMQWDYVEQKLAWSIVFLFGGGFTLAAGCEQSGLSHKIGTILTSLKELPHYLLLLFISLGIAVFTEITSNVVTATILLPPMLKMAECIGMHPLRMGLTVVLSCSFSFCLPSATPPNAIVFSTGKIKVVDMATTGIFINLICVLNLSFMSYFYSVPIFHTDSFPNWIKPNCTST